MGVFAILDLVIGIIFIYFILSIMASAILEIFSNFAKWRAYDLRDWVYSTFDQPFDYKKPGFFKRKQIRLQKWIGTYKSPNKCLGEEIWHHFAVDGLSKAGKRVSYIPSSEFVKALFDIVVNVQLVDKYGRQINNKEVLDTYGLATVSDEEGKLVLEGSRQPIVVDNTGQRVEVEYVTFVESAKGVLALDAKAKPVVPVVQNAQGSTIAVTTQGNVVVNAQNQLLVDRKGNYLVTDGAGNFRLHKCCVNEHGEPLVINDAGEVVMAVDGKPLTKVKQALRKFKRRKITVDGYSKEKLREAVLHTIFLSRDQKDVVLQYIAESDNIIEVRKNFEVWFDNAMERLTGDYKRFSQRFLLVISLLVCGVLNIDTIDLATYLYNNPTARTQLALIASDATRDPQYINAVENIKRYESEKDSITRNRELLENTQLISTNLKQIMALNDSLNKLNLPIGWKQQALKAKKAKAEASSTAKESGGSQTPSQANKPVNGNNQSPTGTTESNARWYDDLVLPGNMAQWISKIAGIVITSFALTLGATFWFDLLNKLVNIRSAGRKPDVTKEGGVIVG